MKKQPTKSKPVIAQSNPGPLSQCFLEHAARETQWATESAKECDYRAASDALVRRSVWLMAALIAKERKA